MRTLAALLVALPLALAAQVTAPAPAFASAKGTLPVPITGQYTLAAPFGSNVVAGLEIGSKGCLIRGKGTSQARAVYEGKVSAVYQFETGYCVILRHGTYLTVYARLEDVSVRQGQTVKALASLGRVAPDENGQRTLHFQIRQEREPLNPAAWVKF